MLLPLLSTHAGRRGRAVPVLSLALTLLASACTGAGSGKLDAPDAGDAATAEVDDEPTTEEPDAATDEAAIDGQIESLVDAGDGSDASDPVADTDASDITVAELDGHWSNPSWGDMVLRRVGDEVWGTYSYDQGTVVGTYENGLFVGWWTEVPSRLPTADK